MYYNYIYYEPKQYHVKFITLYDLLFFTQSQIQLKVFFFSLNMGLLFLFLYLLFILIFYLFYRYATIRISAPFIHMLALIVKPHFIVFTHVFGKISQLMIGLMFCSNSVTLSTSARVL